MKPISFPKAALCAGTLLTSVGLLLAAEPQYTVIERGLHHRVWKRVDADGAGLAPNPAMTLYTELATGLYYVEQGQPNVEAELRETRELVEPFPDGAIARYGPHKVIFAPNLATPEGAVDMLTPDGKRLRSRVAGLSYADALGNSVLIAEVKDCEGKITAVNEVTYPDCMDGLLVDVRLTYTKAGLEQDVIIRQSPPSPKLIPGLDAATARLQVLTEFLEAPAPSIARSTPVLRAGVQLVDEVLDFGEHKLGSGKAFLQGTRGGLAEVPVSKAWVEADGRKFLVEEVPLALVEEALSALPKPRGASVKPAGDSLRLVASAERVFPPPLARKAQPRKEMALALSPRSGPEFVVDYVSLGASATNLTLDCGMTYLVSSLVNIVGTLTAEPGCVIKIQRSATAGFACSNLVVKIKPYSTVVVTASDDNSYGETVSGSSGSPTAFYGRTAFDLSQSIVAPTLSNIRFCYLSNALSGTGITLNNAQAIRCKTLFTSGSLQPTLRNVLLWQIDTVVPGGSSQALKAEHLTAHYCTNFFSTTQGTACFTNSLLVCVTNLPGTVLSNATVQLNSDAGVFQAVGGGNHYLAPDSPYRNAGTTNIYAPLLAEIRTRTTYPPVVFSNVTLSADAVFSPQAQPDTDAPDIGFEYERLDYAFGGTTCNANLTFAPGTAVGWFRTSSGWYHAGHGIKMADGKTVNFDGRAESPVYWVRCSVVQEGGNGLWAGGYGPGGITGWAMSAAAAPTVQARFLKASMFATEAHHFRDDNGWLTVRARDSEFRGGGLGDYACTLALTNCLVEGSFVSLDAGQVDISWNVRNCTWISGWLNINRYANACLVRVWDTVFDRTAVTTADQYATNATYTDYRYNAFLVGQSRTSPTNATDILVSGSYGWQSIWGGDYYLPNSTTLTNSGSTTAPVLGLYHFTTQTNQLKEQLTTLDRGYHYVARDAQGRFSDFDGDGVPDYWEDSDGDGTKDSGERDWQNSENRANGAAGLQVFTPLKR